MADGKDSWVVTVGWHTEFFNFDNSHKVNLKRFWDEDEAKEFYNNISTAYAKLWYTKEGLKDEYSSSWARYIPNVHRFESNYWVSQVLSYNENDDSYSNKINYFSNKNEAKKFYEEIKNEVPKKISYKGEVLEEEGIEAGYLF